MAWYVGIGNCAIETGNLNMVKYVILEIENIIIEYDKYFSENIEKNIEIIKYLKKLIDDNGVKKYTGKYVTENASNKYVVIKNLDKVVIDKKIMVCIKKY